MIDNVLAYTATGYTSMRLHSAHTIYITIKVYILNENLYINPLFYTLHFPSYIICNSYII